MTFQEIERNLDDNAYQGPGGRDFYQDLLDVFVLPDDALSQRMYSRAWETGHSCGHREVYYHFMGLVRVFRGE